MPAVQVNTLQGCVEQLLGRIYYALEEIEAIDCLQQGHNTASFFIVRGLSLVAKLKSTIWHQQAIRLIKSGGSTYELSDMATEQ